MNASVTVDAEVFARFIYLRLHITTPVGLAATAGSRIMPPAKCRHVDAFADAIFLHFSHRL